MSDKARRKLYLDICDYRRRVVCPLYDNNKLITGQAYNVVCSIERNGWKELSFDIPSKIHTEDGEEDNYILQYLKADYLIRLNDGDEIDWYVISEPKITHDGFSKTVNVIAGHISQLLRLKNLGLEFSDNDGNNVGTAEDLLTTILAGTGWNVGYVHNFVDTRTGETKIRSLQAAAKSGAFKLITSMCELFDAKPIFHGDSKTVDIVPLNPFENYVQGTIPNLDMVDDVLELHYGKNLKNVSRTLNTESMVTKLYAYGSYGDTTSGYCGIDEAVHTEYTLTLNDRLTAGAEYYFELVDDSEEVTGFHFTAPSDVVAKAGDKLIFSFLDPASMMYVYNETQSTADKVVIYPVTRGVVGTKLPCAKTIDEAVPNLFSFVMDFTYYYDVGLFDDEMLKTVAKYQRQSPQLLSRVKEVSAAMMEMQTKLSDTIGTLPFCKLDIAEKMDSDSYLKLKLNKTEEHPDGIIYRTDYDENKKNYFKWRGADRLDTNGDPLNAATSYLYIFHNTTPVTWDTAYLQSMDNEDDPTELTFWISSDSVMINTETDRFYLFSYNGINGRLGSLQSADEAVVASLDKATTVVTEQHPVIFCERGHATGVDTVRGYAWMWLYDPTGAHPSEMYFCFKDKSDTAWKYTYIQDTKPVPTENGQYWFNWRDSILYHYSDGEWTAISSDENVSMLVPSSYRASLTDQKVASLFGTVYMGCKTRDKYYLGMPEYLKHTGTVSSGNYYFEDAYNGYHVFTVTENLNSEDSVTYCYKDNWVTITKDGVDTELISKNYRFDNVQYHASNILKPTAMQDGTISMQDGSMVLDKSLCRSSSYSVIVPNTTYNVDNILNDFDVHFYNDKRMWISAVHVGSGSNKTFEAPGLAHYCKFTKPCTKEQFAEDYANAVIVARNKENTIIIDDINYYKLGCESDGANMGILTCIDNFLYYSDQTYTYYKQVREDAQKAVDQLAEDTSNSIGELWKEGYWQDSNYVDGDELRLYDDALETLKTVAKPETSYTIDYLDLYSSSDDDANHSSLRLNDLASWPDVNISSAVHLVDDEIGVNTWAYLDKIQKCYDKPWETKITINTNLSLIGQHSFSDVLTNIADVSNQIKPKISQYNTVAATHVTKSNLEELLANLVTMERIVENEGGRITEFENEITGHRSMIKQAANLISAEVSRALDEESELRASISMDPETIQATVNAAVKAELGYQVVIDSSDGYLISGTTQSLTLTARLMYGSQDVSDTIPASDFKWEKGMDTTWNGQHIGVKSVTINAAQVADQETFTCKVTGPNGAIYVAKVNIANISGTTSLEAYVTCNTQSIQVVNGTTYTPDWSTNNVIITPKIFENGTAVAPNQNIVSWARRVGSGVENPISPLYETAANGVLTITDNVFKYLDTSTSVTYVCHVTLNGVSTIAEQTFTLLKSSDTAITITNTEIKYGKCKSATDSSQVTNWYDTVPSLDDGDYLWTRTYVRYSTGADTTSYSVSKIGEAGQAGDSVSDVVPLYQTSNNKDTAPAKEADPDHPVTWSTTAITPTAQSPYLWSYEVVKYTGTTQSTTTTPRVIGMYGKNGVTFGITPEDGTIFTPETESLRFTAYVYDGAVNNVDNATSFRWEIYYDGTRTQLQETTKTINFSKLLLSQYQGGFILYLTVTYNGATYQSTVTIVDKTDNYQAVISSSGGDLFYNGTGASTLICRLYQNGTEKDIDGSKFAYRWTRLREDGTLVEPLFKTGKSINVTIEDVPEMITFVCHASYTEGGGDNLINLATFDPPTSDTTGVVVTINAEDKTARLVGKPIVEDIPLKRINAKFLTLEPGTYCLENNGIVSAVATDGTTIYDGNFEVQSNLDLGNIQIKVQKDSDIDLVYPIILRKISDKNYSAQDQFTITPELKTITSDTEPENPRNNQLWLDTSNPKVSILKRYDAATESWVDVSISQSELGVIKSAITNYETQIKELKDRIETTVSETTITKQDIDNAVNESKETIMSSVNQTAEAIRTSISKTDETVKNVDGRITQVQTKIENWMNFGQDGLTLGKSDSQFKARLDNQRLAFGVGNNDEFQALSYFSDNSMYIERAKITDTLSVGNDDGWFDWKMTTNGLAMRWRNK